MCVFGLGLATIPLEAGQPVTVCADDDGPGAAATAALNKAVAALLAQRHHVKVARPQGVKDANALLISNGPDAVRSMVDAATVATVAAVASALIEPLPLFPPLSEPEPYPVDALGDALASRESDRKQGTGPNREVRIRRSEYSRPKAVPSRQGMA